jgi:hypothetical protein
MVTVEAGRATFTHKDGTPYIAPKGDQ